MQNAECAENAEFGLCATFIRETEPTRGAVIPCARAFIWPLPPTSKQERQQHTCVQAAEPAPATISAPTPPLPAPSRPRGAEDDAPQAVPMSASTAAATASSTSTSILSSASPSFSPHAHSVESGGNAALNPLLALQIVIAGEMASIKQRSKAAQQLETYFKALPPSATLFMSYEPYLSVLVEIGTASTKATKEVQENVSLMLKALANHSPHKFVEWVTQNLHAHPGHEAWFVDWICSSLLETECRIPLVDAVEDGGDARHDHPPRVWREKTMEFLEFDTTITRAFSLWRTILDYTIDPAVVSQIIQALRYLLKLDGGDGGVGHQWQAIVLKKLQPHFVDIADVLIGWAMNASPRSPLREDIVSLLEELRQLWVDNSVFSTQLLSSFANDIIALSALSTPLSAKDSVRLNILTVCFMMVAQCVPDLALAASEGEFSVLAKVIQCAVSSRHGAYSVYCLSKCAGYQLSMSSADPRRFSPLVVVSVRFLLTQTASLSRNHDCEVDGVSCILENSLKQLKSGVTAAQDMVQYQMHAVGLLKDITQRVGGNTKGKIQDEKVIEALLSFTCVNATKLLTQLVICLVRFGGAEALKILADDALRSCATMNSEQRSYSLFCTACFVIAMRRHSSSLFQGGEESFGEILQNVARRWNSIVHSNKHPWQFRILLKISRACVRKFELAKVNKSNAALLVDEISISMLRLVAGGILNGGSAATVPYLAETEALELLEFLLSRETLMLELPSKLLLLIINKVKTAIRETKAETRDCCVRILKVLASRCGTPTLGPVLFEIAMDLVLDPDQGIGNSTIAEILPKLSSVMLVSREPSSRPSRATMPNCSSFSAADFASITALLSKKESDQGEWHRKCTTIQARVSGSDDTPECSKPTNSCLLLKTIRQAAVWCGQNRLRTHFGGPVETFLSIEHLLKVSTSTDAKEARHSGTQEFDESWGEGEKSSKGRSTHGRSMSKLMLLEFVSALEVYISNAAYTSEENQSNPESELYKTHLFYRANKKVCEDWLSRYRPRLLEISNSLSQPELSRHHGYAIVTGLVRKLTRLLIPHHLQGPAVEWSRDIEQSVKDLDSALFSLCRNYCKAKDVDSIIGFGAWRDSLSSTLASRTQAMSNAGADVSECWVLPVFPWLKGASLEAEMRYEDAAAEYEAILSGLLPPSSSDGANAERVVEMLGNPIRLLRMSNHALAGCLKQCAKCYAAVRDWTKLRVFVTNFVNAIAPIEDRAHSMEGCQSIFECYDVWKNELVVISALEATEFEDATPLRSWASAQPRKSSAMQAWGILDESHRPIIKTRNSKHIATADYSALREGLARMALKPDSSNPIAGELIGKEVERVLLQVGMLSIDRQSTSTGFENIAHVLHGITELDHACLDSASWSEAYFGLKSTCLAQASTADFQSSDTCGQYLIEVAKLARKQKNFVLADYLLKEAATVTSEGHREALMLEKSDLLASLGLHDEATSLLRALCEKAVDSIRSGAGGHLDDIRVQPLLRLARACDQTQTLEQVSWMSSLIGRAGLQLSPVNGLNGLGQMEAMLAAGQTEETKGQYLAVAAKGGSNSCQAWLTYSDWCYAKAKDEMERIATQNGYIDLNPAEEVQLVQQLDALNLGKVDRDAVVRCFLHLMENGGLIAHRYDKFRQLCILRSPVGVENDAIDQIVALQRECHSHALRFHKLAAEGYGKYLIALDGSSGSSTARSQTITVALRVLRLLTKFGGEKDVVDTIEGTFTHGPVTPWRQVVPQLLARAAHPLPGVSSLICKMLKRLAHHSPYLVVYPAVVDSQTTNWKQNGVSSEHGKKGKLEDVLHELNSVSKELVNGVQLLVSELRRISVLWDEAWISTLVKLSADVSRRSSTLEKEATRVERNSSLSLEEKNDLARRKFVAIMKPILVSIERLWEDSCGRAGKQSTLTRHERFFLHQYGGLITDATRQLRDMCNADTPFDTSVGLPGPNFIWNPFTEILKSLQNSTARNDSLPLQEISPAMASISKKHFSINMPGVLSTSMDSTFDSISVHEVRSTVMVLRTKTKPKCLEFVGSNGNSYKYLLKAREDLRLDERIMQFLKTVNEFLRADSFASARDLSAQNYSVIPLSQDSGLIQMVPNVTPMFQVFTNWSEQSSIVRSVPASSPTKVPGSSSSTHGAQQQSPTAAFYMKLKQYGITDVSPNQRLHWPESILKQVYHDLVAQRPRNVLQQEILLGSGDLRESWSKAARLSKSLAVMSALGYIIGLGDRHLDNILLCTKSGDVLHIDYNVCFDKGLKLKVPEIVPFRLTPMLQDALGLTGVEGKFRVAFETTLRIVRANNARESLLTLLEAFVYDPLVDWTVDESRRGGSEDLKSRLEVNVNLSLFLSRAEERRHDATAFEHQLDLMLTELSRSLNAVPTQVSELFSDTAELTKLEKQEEKLSAEVSTLEEKLSECGSLQTRSSPEFDAASSRYAEIKVKLTGFANQCVSRHHQIEIWRGKCANFPNVQTFATVLASTAHSSFSSLCGRLCEVASTARGSILPRELLASLHAKSQGVDAGVAHLRYSLELVMSSLHPWLLSYSHSREDADNFVLLKTGSQDNNIYWLWWKRCEEYLQLVETGDMEAARKLLASSLHSPSSLIANPVEITESVKMVQNLGELEQNLTVESAFDVEKPIMEAEFQDQLQRIFTDLSAMKLSNAQGQRLLKLAGATWIISRFGWHQRANSEERSVDTMFRPPALVDNALFRLLLGDAKACTALLNVVMTPKGAAKKIRAADVLNGTTPSQQQKENASNTTKVLGRLVQVLNALQGVFVAIHDNFVLDVHGMRLKRDANNSCVSLLMGRLNSGGSIREIFEVASVSISAASTEQPLAAALEESSSVCAVLRSISALLDQFKLLGESLPCVQGLSELELSSWIRLTLTLSNFCTADEPGSQSASGAITGLFFAHATSFMRDHLVVPFEQILSDIISQEWKFGFNAAAEKTTLSENWSRFVASQIPEMFPSTLTLAANPQSSFKSMEAAVAELMSLSGKYCVELWRQSASEKWTLAIGDLYRYHRCRLWYSFWFSGQAPTSEYSGKMTQPQLLASLPAFAAELSRLSGEQGALGSLVLELAQQLEYVASQVGVSSTEANFHGQVQGCYSQVSSLFEYIRDLADLLQGISIIETSTGEFGQSRGASTELEVDVIGRAMLQEGVEAAQSFSSVRLQMLEKSAVTERLKEELAQKRSSLQFTVDAKETLTRKLRSQCQEREEIIAATAKGIAQRVTHVMALLKAFDKFKVPSREKAGNKEILPAITESSASKNRRRKSGMTPKAESEADELPSFSFMENERLVKILLRNIKSADHLKTLEGVLDKHETNSSTLHGVIASVENALRQFASDTQSSVLIQDPPNGTSSSESSSHPSFLAATQRSTSANAVSKSGNAEGNLLASAISPSSQLSPSHEMVRALMNMKGALVIERKTNAEQTGSNLLDIANKLVKVCFKLFFEATDMADRLSSLEKAPSGESGEEDALADAHDDGGDFNVVFNGEVASASSAGNVGADSDGDPSNEEKPGSANEAHVQVKNRHGIQVLKRVEEKLCGQVMEHGQPRTLTVEEQASWLIESATKADNLCMMYEGWTPWI